MRSRTSARRQAMLREHATFESLETRCMLANVHWNVDTDGFWDVAANWIDDSNVARTPTASDDVYLDRGAAQHFTITHRSGSDTVKSIHATSDNLVLSGGSLTNTTTSDLGGAFTLSGGDLLASGPLTTSGNTTYTSGTVRATGGIINTGQWTLSGSTLKQFGWFDTAAGSFENRGTVVNSGTGNLGIWNLFTFTNTATGLLDIQGDTSVVNVGGASDAFTNIGTLRKSVGSGTSTISSKLFSNAAGTIDVRTGTIAIATQNGVSTGGIFTVSVGAILDLAGGGSFATQYVGSYTGSGAGIIRVDNGVLRVGAAGATFNFPGSLFQWTSGTIDGGATGLTNTGAMTLSGASTKTLNGVLHNAGTINHAGAGILSAPQPSVPTRLDNLLGGIYDFQVDSSILSNTLGDTAFNNAGTLRKSGGIGTSNITIGFNNNSGVIDVRTGTLQLPTGGNFATPKFVGGTFQAAAGAVLELPSIVATISGNFTGSGQGTVRLGSGTTTVDPAGAAFDFPEGLFQWTGGTIDGGITGLVNRGFVTLAGTVAKHVRGVFDSSGTIIHAGIGNLGIPGVATFTNRVNAVYDFQADGGVAADDSVSVLNFINRGTLRKSGGSGTSLVSPSGFSNDNGTIDVRSGTLAIGTQKGVSTGGTFIATAGGVLDLAGGGTTPTQYVGTYTGSGDGVVRVATGTLKAGSAGATFNFPVGLFQWTSGTIDGGATGLTNAGFMTVAGTAQKQLFGALRNAGTVIHSGTGSVEARVNINNSNPTRLNNLSGGVYDFQTDSSFTRNILSDDTEFNNAGTLRKSGGNGESFFNNVPFNNTGGLIDVRTGTLSIVSTSTGHTGGTFQVAFGAALDLTRSGSPVFSGNYSGSGQGAIRLDSGTLVVGAGGATFDFSEGLLQWAGGTIDASAAPLTNLGSMTLNTFATSLTNLRGTLQNAGNFLLLDRTRLLVWGESGLGNLTNLAGGVYELQGAAVIVQAAAHGPGSAMHNFGTVLKSTGAGTARIDTESFDNVGTVEVDAGTLQLQRIVTQAQGTTLSGGTWKVDDGATLEFTNSPRFTTNAASVVLDGPGSHFPAIEYVTTNTGSLTLAGGRSLSLPVGRVARSFNTGLTAVALAFDPSTGNVFEYDQSGVAIREYTPNGTEVLPRIPVPGGGAIELDLDVASTSLSVGGVTVPAGTLLVFRANASPVYAIDKNTGTILASVAVSLPSTPVGGSYHAGRNSFFFVTSTTIYEVNPATGAVLQSFPVQPSGSPSYFVGTFGDLEVDPSTGNLLVATELAPIRELTTTGQFVRDQSVAGLGLGRLSGMAINEATRRLWVCDATGKVYELEAVFANNGSVTLDAGSTLDVPGTFAQTASGTLSTRVGGNPASGLFGRIVVGGPATLDGTFGVNLVNGFGPVVGQQFPILTFPSATGSFSEFTGLNGGRLPLFSVDQLAQSVVLNAIGSAADLAFDGFMAATFPATAVPGQNISVTYDVRNLSATPAVGDWFDSVYLSRDGSLDESDTLLGRVEHHGGVAAMSSYRETLTVPLPALADTNYRVLVLSDSRGLVPDGNRANNFGFSSSTIAVTMPSLSLGIPIAASIASGQDRYYRLTAPPGKDVKITAGFANADVAQVFVRYRDLPDRTNFDQATSASDLEQRLLITNSQGGSYYVLVHSLETSGVDSSFTLLAEATGFEIVTLTPTRGSNQGQANIQVTGSQFTPQTTLSLNRDSGESRAAENIQFVDANHLRATFNLVDLPTGNYRLRAEDSGRTVDALDTFTVTGEPLGLVSLSITSPAFVRVGSSIPVKISIDNGNDAQAVAPILQVVATNVTGEKERFVNGGGLDALPGVLPPLFQGSVGVTFEPDPKSNGTESTFQLVALNPSLTVIDWDSQKESLRHPRIPVDAWDAIWANLRPVLGNTMADYYALLQNDSRQLSLLGVKTNSIDQLFHFELRKANDLPAVPVPAATVDVAFPAPGLPLVFGRDFGDSIAQRYRVGRLGRGWVDNFDFSLTNDSTAGIVTILQGTVPRLFAKNKSGGYEGLPGDFATLTETGNGFQLREKDGSVIAFRADGKLDYLQDINANRITAGYTGSQLTTLTHSNGSALTLAYNAQGRISQVSDPAGRVATYVYDASGEHLTSVTTTEGTTDYAYTSQTNGPRAHALTSIGFPTDTHLFFDYDSKGRLARQQQDGGAGELTFTYDVTSYRVKDALGNLTDIFFDDAGRIKQTFDGLARSTRVGHTGIFPTRVIAADGTSSTAKYDQRGNVIESLDPLGQEQQYDFEPTFNNLVGWSDALGHTTSFSHDPRGNPQSTAYADGTTEQVTFDSKGNLVRSVNRRGQLVSYTYDVNGLPTRKDLPDGTHVDYTYDARKNLLSATGATGATTMEYDLADRMTKITYPGGRFLEFTYDTGGRRTRSTDQSGFAVNYSYDVAGRLAQLTDSSAQSLVTYQYDSAGRLMRETDGNGTSTNYDYDAANQLLHLVNFAPDGTTILSRFDYTYDDNGRRTSMTTLEGTAEYVYDAADRLIQATLPGGRTLTYAYDAAGNRTTSGDNGATTAYTVNDMNQYVVVGGTSQSFDEDGNLTSSSGPSGPRSNSYNAEGQLTSVVTAQGTWTYEYDALGNRLSSTHDGVKTEYLTDPAGLGDVFGEYDGAGNLRAHYVHGLGLVNRIDVSGPAAYYQFDAQGNTAQLTDAAGTVVNSYSYLPFGEAVSTSELVPNPFTFVGQLGVMREGNGLNYMRNRWYDPAQGRFTQQDPIGMAGGTNLYSYAENNPSSLVDPEGLAVPSYAYNGLRQLGNLASPAARGAGASVNTLAANATQTTFANSAGTQAVHAEIRSLMARQAAEAAAREAASKAATRQLAGRVGLYGLLAAEIAFVGALDGSLKRGLYTIASTSNIKARRLGDLPECALSGVASQLLELCKSPAFSFTPSGQSKTIQLDPVSFDPNDILGPGGFGSAGYLAGAPTLPYTIHFENAPTAGGPATEITVTHQLDADLDLDTFQLGDFGFGDLVIDVPDGRQFFYTRIDLRDQPAGALTPPQDLFVDVVAELDRATRIVTWKLTTLDPETLDLPINPFLGFLPPDKTTGEGQGFVMYSARPKAGSPSGTRFDAQASIIFDANAAIATNVFVNTLDLGGPTSSVSPLPAVSYASNFTVSWSGSDDAGGSGIGNFDIYVSDNGGPFALWKSVPGDTLSDTFHGEIGHTYAFYSVATDNVGHVEVTPAAAQATTIVASAIVGRLLFYNQSGIGGPAAMYDGNDPTINSLDDNAIATDKVAYLPGAGPATFASVSSYSKGINGVMVDIAGPHPSITAADFIFRVGNNNAPSTWATADAPSAVSVRAGAGVGGSDRVEIVWADNILQKTWLEVITKANSNTGLVQNPGLQTGQGDIFFFGNAIGDTGAGNTVNNSLVNSIDQSGIRLHAETRANNIPITNVYDINRDGCVNAIDESIARLNATNPSTTLKYLNLTTIPAAPEAAGGDSVSPLVANDLGVASALAAPALIKLDGGPPKWLSNRIENIDLNSGSPAKLAQYLPDASTPRSRALLQKFEYVADALGVDDELLESLLADLRVQGAGSRIE